jgi:uncharacterized protein (TIGR03086 family)
MTGQPPGANGLLAGAIRYALAACAPIVPGELTLPTPCAGWDLAALLDHLGESMVHLEVAIRTGRLGLDDRDGPDGSAAGDPVEVIRDRAARLLWTSYRCDGPDRLVAVGGLPVPAGLVACTGAVEIAVHGWDVSAARGRGVPQAPIPAPLATRMLRFCPLLVAGRDGLFAVPVAVPAQASPGDRLVGYLGRHPR